MSFRQFSMALRFGSTGNDVELDKTGIIPKSPITCSSSFRTGSRSLIVELTKTEGGWSIDIYSSCFFQGTRTLWKWSLAEPKHKNILVRILKDIYSHPVIGPILGFKGGHPVAVLLKDTAQPRADNALTHGRSGALYHDGFSFVVSQNSSQSPFIKGRGKEKHISSDVLLK